MAWFNRKDKGILTPTAEKMEAPDGIWFKTPSGKIIHTRELKNNAFVSPEDGYHVRIGSEEYFQILFDGNNFKELDGAMESGDPLGFEDSKPYPKRIAEGKKKSGLKDAVRTATGKINGIDITIACMDFSFIGGSMGSVVGEKVARAIDHSLKKKIPLLIISKSGGCPNARGGALTHANGQNLSQISPTFRSQNPVHLTPDRSDHRWRNCIVCHAWRL